MTTEEKYVDEIFTMASNASQELIGEMSANFIIGYTRREFQLMLLSLDLNEEQLAVLAHRLTIH